MQALCSLKLDGVVSQISEIILLSISPNMFFLFFLFITLFPIFIRVFKKILNLLLRNNILVDYIFLSLPSIDFALFLACI